MTYNKSKMMILSSNLTNKTVSFKNIKKHLFSELSETDENLLLKDLKTTELNNVINNLKNYFVIQKNLELLQNDKVKSVNFFESNNSEKIILSGPNRISSETIDELLLTGVNPIEIFSEKELAIFNNVNSKYWPKIKSLLAVNNLETNFSLTSYSPFPNSENGFDMYSENYDIYFRNFLTDRERKSIFISPSTFELSNKFNYPAGIEFGKYLVNAMNLKMIKSSDSIEDLNDLVIFSGIQQAIDCKSYNPDIESTDLIKTYLSGVRDYLEVCSKKEIVFLLPELKSITPAKMFKLND